MPRTDLPLPSLTQAEAAFVGLFRAQLAGRGWVPSMAPDDWYDGMEVGSADGRCLVWVDLSVDDCVVLTAGAYYNGTVTTVGCLHSQRFGLELGDVRVPASKVGGPVSEQVVRVADWLDWLVRRPILRREWSGTVREYSFADDGTGLVVSGSHQDRSGPPLRESVVRALL